SRYTVAWTNGTDMPLSERKATTVSAAWRVTSSALSTALRLWSMRATLAQHRVELSAPGGRCSKTLGASAGRSAEATTAPVGPLSARWHADGCGEVWHAIHAQRPHSRSAGRTRMTDSVLVYLD